MITNCDAKRGQVSETRNLTRLRSVEMSLSSLPSVPSVWRPSVSALERRLAARRGWRQHLVVEAVERIRQADHGLSRGRGWRHTVRQLPRKATEHGIRRRDRGSDWSSARVVGDIE